MWYFSEIFDVRSSIWQQAKQQAQQSVRILNSSYNPQMRIIDICLPGFIPTLKHTRRSTGERTQIVQFCIGQVPWILHQTPYGKISNRRFLRGREATPSGETSTRLIKCGSPDLSVALLLWRAYVFRARRKSDALKQEVHFDIDYLRL